MIAIIDSQVGGGVEIRPAAAAGLLGGFMDVHAVVRIRQPHGCRKARDSSADDVNGLLHQMKP